MGRGLRAGGGVEGGSEGGKEGWTESGTEGGTGGFKEVGNWAIGVGAAGRGGAGGCTASGTEGCKKGSKEPMAAAAAGRAGAEGCTASGTEGCKKGSKEPMAAAPVGRAGAEGCWSGPGGAIVVPAVVRGWPAAAAGPPPACGASRVSNSSREQASPGRNAQRAAPSEHRLGLEAAGVAGGRTMGRAQLRARTESPHRWQQDGPWRGVPARFSRYPATGWGRQPALRSWPIPGAGAGGHSPDRANEQRRDLGADHPEAVAAGPPRDRPRKPKTVDDLASSADLAADADLASDADLPSDGDLATDADLASDGDLASATDLAADLSLGPAIGSRRSQASSGPPGPGNGRSAGPKEWHAPAPGSWPPSDWLPSSWPQGS